jgi:hypothetical protein
VLKRQDAPAASELAGVHAVERGVHATGVASGMTLDRTTEGDDVHVEDARRVFDAHPTHGAGDDGSTRRFHLLLRFHQVSGGGAAFRSPAGAPSGGTRVERPRARGGTAVVGWTSDVEVARSFVLPVRYRSKVDLLGRTKPSADHECCVARLERRRSRFQGLHIPPSVTTRSGAEGTLPAARCHRTETRGSGVRAAPPVDRWRRRRPGSAVPPDRCCGDGGRCPYGRHVRRRGLRARSKRAVRWCRSTTPSRTKP